MRAHKDIEQRSDEWHQIRKGKITGTTLKAIMGTPKARKEAVYRIIGERLKVGIGDQMENPMDRGTRLEEDAVKEFELKTGLEVDVVGFCEHDENPSIANSPDGLIGETMAIEIKCPMEAKHVQYWLENDIPDEYKWQIVQYFVTNEKLEKLYFVSYNPEIPVYPLHIREIGREELGEDIDKAKSSQEKFLSEVDEKLKAIIKL